MTRAPRRSAWRWGSGTPWVTVLFVALTLRLLYVASIHDAIFFRHLQTNTERYHAWALRILDGKSPLPPFEQAPGYPYLVAGLYALFGADIMPVVLFQAAIGAVTCLLVGLTGRALFGPRAGWIAAMLAAAYGPFLYFTGELLPVTCFVFAATAAMLAAARAAWVRSAGFWAAALILRSNALLAYPLVFVDAWRHAGRTGLARVAAPCAACLLAFAALNASFGGEVVWLTTSGGVNLWLGNNPHADGVSPFVPAAARGVTQRVREQAADAAAADHLFRREAFAYWLKNPGDAALLAWKKLLWTFAERELPNNADIEWRTGQSWLFAVPLFPFGMGLLLPLAFAGALLLGREWSRPLLLLAPVAIAVGTGVVFFTNARFRLVMVPTLLLLAGVALDRFPAVLRRPSRRLVLALAGVALGTVLAWGDFYRVRSYDVAEITVNTGILEREAGRPADAVRHLRRGLARNPGDSVAWVHLALALEQLGRPRQALRSYLDGLAAVRGDVTLLRMSARFFQRYGLSLQALRGYAEQPDEPARAALIEQADERLPPAAGEGR